MQPVSFLSPYSNPLWQSHVPATREGTQKRREPIASSSQGSFEPRKLGDPG